MPTLLPSEKERPKLTLHEKCEEAFRRCDADGSGSISKRELLTALKLVGIRDNKSAMEMFAGFDTDGSGDLEFHEFEEIAKRLFVKK